MWAIFRTFRALTEANEKLSMSTLALHRSVLEVAEAQRESGPSEARLDELERRQAMWQVEMEALVAKAEGTLQAALNAESRTRTMKKHYEKLADPLDIEGEEVDETVPGLDAARSEAERLQALRLDVAPADKKNALKRYKFS